eukprot:2816546-Rhodomonas_salina.1
MSLRGPCGVCCGVSGTDRGYAVLTSRMADETLRVWDVPAGPNAPHAGAMRRMLSGNAGRVWGVGVSRDGTLVASAAHGVSIALSSLL